MISRFFSKTISLSSSNCFDFNMNVSFGPFLSEIKPNASNGIKNCYMAWLDETPI